MAHKYIVVETDCYPRKFKVAMKGFEHEMNDVCNYFYSKEEADNECKKRNRESRRWK